MGVDYLSMELHADPASFSRWHALQSWIEGPQLLAEIASPDEDLMARAIIDANPHGFVTDKTELLALGPGRLFILPYLQWVSAGRPANTRGLLSYDPAGSVSFLKDETAAPLLFLEADWTPDMLKSLLDEGYAGGISLKGTDENETGIKDYSDMDEMIYFIQAQ